MMARRSSSDSPPQIPYGSCTARACARQAAITGHDAQIALAVFSRLRRRGPRSPSGWKNISEGSSRHEPSYCHSHSSATGRGKRDISAMAIQYNRAISCSSGNASKVVQRRVSGGVIGHFTPRLDSGRHRRALNGCSSSPSAGRSPGDPSHLGSPLWPWTVQPRGGRAPPLLSQ